MKKIVRKFTKFNDAEFTAEHVTIYEDGTVVKTSQNRFEYEQQKKISHQWNKQTNWKESVHDVCNPQKSNVLQFQPRTK